MVVNEFKKGDNIVVYGWKGKVIDVHHLISSDNKPCTYLQVSFEEPNEIGYQYHNKWYGGLDNVVAFGTY